MDLSDEEDNPSQSQAVVIEILSDEDDDIFEMYKEIPLSEQYTVNNNLNSPLTSPLNSPTLNSSISNISISKTSSDKPTPVMIDLDNDDFDYDAAKKNVIEDDILYVETKTSPVSKLFQLVSSLYSESNSIDLPPQLNNPTRINNNNNNNNNNNLRTSYNYQRFFPSTPPVPTSLISLHNAINTPFNSALSAVNNNNNNIPLNNNSNPLNQPIIEPNVLSQLFESNSNVEKPTLEGHPTLKVTLLKHQKEALHWMVKQENEKLRGGILADDMGCGKTVSMIACMLENKFDEPYQRNLIVVPNSCLLQWEKEINSKTDNSILKIVKIHYGPQRTLDHHMLEKTDVVLTTYGTLASEFQAIHSPLLKNIWNRVILDEAHYIKNRQTKVANACFNLTTNYRWCLTGTPIQNRLEDIFSLFIFLKFEPYNDLQVCFFII